MFLGDGHRPRQNFLTSSPLLQQLPPPPPLLLQGGQLKHRQSRCCRRRRRLLGAVLLERDFRGSCFLGRLGRGATTHARGHEAAVAEEHGDEAVGAHGLGRR